MIKTDQNPHLQPAHPPAKNATVQPGAPDFIEEPEVPVTAPGDHEPFPWWLYVVCGVALFLAGSSFTGFVGTGHFDQGPGAPLVAENSGPQVIQQLDPMELGKAIYGGNCANCHQASGAGQPGSYPPLVGSEWVNGNTTDLFAIMLHGLQGPVTVAGGSFGTQQMPGWGTSLSDEKIAAVMTYVRASWGNTAGAVKPEEVTAARAKFASQGDNAYTQDQLLKIDPKK